MLMEAILLKPIALIEAVAAAKRHYKRKAGSLPDSGMPAGSF